MFRKKDDLEEYYKERKIRKHDNKYEMELERKVLGKENKKTGQKILGTILGIIGIIFILCILIKQPFIMGIIDSHVSTVICIAIFPVLFFVSAFFIEHDEETNEKSIFGFNFDFSEKDDLKENEEK